MIISELWLREWAATELGAEGIAERLTLAGLEVDGVTRVADPIDQLVVGKVVSAEPHPDADRLQLTLVDVGTEEPLQIVCGAPNARAELLVAVALEGAQLPNGLKIKATDVRGVKSNGMLCSAAELGLSEESDGILELESDAQIGQRVDQYLQLHDHLIDIDLTPNRGDCLSVQGVARELKVLADAKLSSFDVADVESASDSQIDVMLRDEAACPRYIGRIIEGLDTGARTPLWMQERLRRCGVRPISAVVDITNYVMLELGQPMHAFDRSKLNGAIIVRHAEQGESIRLLDESTATLRADTLVIADTNGPIAIAGVMGGLDSAIDDSTTGIVLEAAHFTRKAVAGAARSYGLHTESSHRFERGVDPQLAERAIQRATQLVLQICGGTAGPLCQQNNSERLPTRPPVALRQSKLNQLLGMQLDAPEVETILGRVSDTLEPAGGSWLVTPPSYRFDIEYEADLIEEVARVRGYDSVPTALPRIAPRSAAASEQTIGLRQVKQSLVARDFREVISYSFVDPDRNSEFSSEAPIRLRNPLAENLSVMRTSLLPGLVGALEFNLKRQRDRVRLFEAGATYHLHGDQFVERQRLAAVVCGPVLPEQWAGETRRDADFYDLKGDLSAVLSLTGLKEPFIFNEFEHIAMQSGQVSSVNKSGVNGQLVDLGWLGRLHPSLQKKIGATAPVLVFELDLERALEAELPAFAEVSRFPSVRRDLSIVVGQGVSAASLLSCVRAELGSALNKALLFDVYEGAGVEAGCKSISLGLVLQHNDRTLTDAESDALIESALAVLAEQYGAKLRA